MADRQDPPDGLPELPFGDPPLESTAPADDGSAAAVPPDGIPPDGIPPDDVPPDDVPPAASPTSAATDSGRPAKVAIADGLERKLDPRSISASRLVGGIWTTALAAINLVGIAVFSLLGPLGALADLGLLAGWAAFFGMLSVWTWFGPALRWKHASYRVDEKGIQIRQGIWWRSVVNVPKSRVQHTDVSQGPVERNFELGTLVIHTAGTQHASVPLGGLTREDASAIRDHLIEGGEDDAV